MSQQGVVRITTQRVLAASCNRLVSSATTVIVANAHHKETAPTSHISASPANDDFDGRKIYSASSVHKLDSDLYFLFCFPLF